MVRTCRVALDLGSVMVILDTVGIGMAKLRSVRVTEALPTCAMSQNLSTLNCQDAQ